MLEKLQEQGWYLLPAGLERLLENAAGTNVDLKQATKLALDTDLREIGGGAFASLSIRGTKTDTIDGNIVVQILKIRNISAPKANEESKVAPRLLKLTLTDGQTQYSAIEGEPISSISLDTPPGTKIYLKNGPIKISQGLLILNSNCVSVLGGKVSALVEKWELGRTMAKYAKGGRLQFSASGPPPWIPFGQKIQQNLPQDKNFKSLQTKEKDESKENAEFNALRNDAIAEATKLGTKKTFGGGAKQMVDANVQKIMDKGFTEDEAVHALKLTRNNVHRALSNLQRIEKRKQTQNDNTGKFEPTQKPGKRGPGGKRDSEMELTSKPSAKVSLFDFLEDILPESETTNKKNTSKESTPFTGKDSSAAADHYSNKQSSYNSYSNANASSRNSNSTSGTNYSSQQQQQNSSTQYNSNKNYNQRFENNISSSFANRNTSTTSSNRNYNQQASQQQSYQQNASQSGGYKSQDYNSSRYRGPQNASNGSHPNEGAPRGRQDSKYNQSHSSYNPHSQQSQYRNDNYNNNNPSSGGRGSKYDSTTNTSGKGQQANYNSYPSQGYAAQGDSRKYPNGPSNQYQQQQQQQSSFHSGNKPVQGYNASGAAGASTNPQQQKGSRYSKEESQKFTGSQTNPNSTQGRNPPPHQTKGQSTQGSSSTAPSQPPFKQPSTTPTGNNNSKITQLTEAAANIQLSSKPFANKNPQMVGAPKPHQGPMGSTSGPVPPQPTASATAPVVPKNFIQLPNGFNYNPYQIMGFQNKQTNEFALNVLKSQQFDPTQQSAGPPVAAVSGPIPGVAMAPSAAVVPQVLTATPPNLPPTATAVLPNWKIGDRCLAKYWEDGGFYNAEITAISKSTFVVCFLEYGNYEEVLKTDCIPLAQPTTPTPTHPPPHGQPPPTAMGFHPSASPHLPPGASILPHPPPPTGVYPNPGIDCQSGQHYAHGYKPQPSQYSQHHALSHQQQQRPAKFREQRPMYVPPAQRK